LAAPSEPKRLDALSGLRRGVARTVAPKAIIRTVARRFDRFAAIAGAELVFVASCGAAKSVDLFVAVAAEALGCRRPGFLLAFAGAEPAARRRSGVIDDRVRGTLVFVGNAADAAMVPWLLEMVFLAHPKILQGLERLDFDKGAGGHAEGPERCPQGNPPMKEVFHVLGVAI